jgi:hypothetical protein
VSVVGRRGGYRGCLGCRIMGEQESGGRCAARKQSSDVERVRATCKREQSHLCEHVQLGTKAFGTLRRCRDIHNTFSPGKLLRGHMVATLRELMNHLR